jgi:hypothetical protein
MLSSGQCHALACVLCYFRCCLNLLQENAKKTLSTTNRPTHLAIKQLPHKSLPEFLTVCHKPAASTLQFRGIVTLAF